MKDLSENYHALFDYYLDIKSEYYSLIGKVRHIKSNKLKSETQGRIDRLKKVIELNRKQLVELDEKILFYTSELYNCPCVNRWIDFNKEEKQYREKLRKSEKKMNEGLIQNSYIRENIIYKLLEQKQDEQD